MGWKDSNGDGIIEEHARKPGDVLAEDEQQQHDAHRHDELHKDDLMKVGINVITAPVNFNTLITNLRSDFQYEAMLLGLQSGVPPESDDDAERMALDGPDTFLVLDANEAGHASGGAESSGLMDVILATHDIGERKKASREVETIADGIEWLDLAARAYPKDSCQQPFRQS